MEACDGRNRTAEGVRSQPRAFTARNNDKEAPKIVCPRLASPF